MGLSKDNSQNGKKSFEHDYVSWLLNPYPRFDLIFNDSGLPEKLKAKEPQLKGVGEGQKEIPDSVGVAYDGELIGGVTIVSFTNLRKMEPRNVYSRIDIVVVEKRWRGLGVSNLLLLLTLIQILRSFQESVYSISSLVAHGAIEYVLRNLGFVIEMRKEELFSRCSLSLSSLRQVKSLIVDYRHQTAAAAESVFHQLAHLKIG